MEANLKLELSDNDANRLHEAQQAVNLADSPLLALASADNPLLAEIGLELLAKLREVDLRLTRLKSYLP